MDKTFRIYKHENINNGKCYIGLTSKSVEIRFKEHLRDALNYESKYHFHNAIRKYPISVWVSSIIVDNISTLIEAQELEKKSILKKIIVFSKGII